MKLIRQKFEFGIEYLIKIRPDYRFKLTPSTTTSRSKCVYQIYYIYDVTVRLPMYILKDQSIYR